MHYTDVSFVVDATKEEVLKIMTAYVNKDTEIIVIDGYSIKPNDLIKLEVKR